jgi:hypothetical protein
MRRMKSHLADRERLGAASERGEVPSLPVCKAFVL